MKNQKLCNWLILKGAVLPGSAETQLIHLFPVSSQPGFPVSKKALRRKSMGVALQSSFHQ